MNGPYDNILQTVGNTPIVRLNRLAPEGVNVYVKVESFNPMGSVKDRLALGIIDAAERQGDLKPGQTVIEATSGNTGIGLAMVCAQRGYPLVVVMPENCSIERRKIMRFLGARVVLTPAAEKGTGMLRKAQELADKHGWYLTRQFDNDANADIHSTTTAQEILRDFDGKRLDYWVSGFGTGGTLKGVARALKQARPDVRIIATEPENSVLLGSGIAQPIAGSGEATPSHPNFRPHLMQGWSPDFISKLAADVLAAGLVDDFVGVNGERSLQLCREIAQQEGIFCGISSGATLAGALQIAATAEPGSNILCMLPDTGERYLSTTLFEDVPEDMTDEEMTISHSSPLCQFGDGASTAPPPAAIPVTADRDASAELNLFIHDAGSPVVMFALEWCEFCWSVRKLFDRLGIDYRSVDLDSVPFQAGNRGGKLRIALHEKVGAPTIPQVFIKGEYIGGATETLEAYNSGALQAKLAACGLPATDAVAFDALTLLPQWLQTRAG